jgi:hypothetical protein
MGPDAGGTPQAGTGGAQGTAGAAGGVQGTAGAAGGAQGTAGAAGGVEGTAGAGGGVQGTAGAAGGSADGGFVADFTPRAKAALAAGAPSWICATTLPTVPVADAAAAREAVRQFVAQVAGVSAADAAVRAQTCGAPNASCAATFAHDCAKSGGDIYNTVAPLAEELNASATAVEETIWTPMQNGISYGAAVVLSGISDGTLVGLADFNYAVACP